MNKEALKKTLRPLIKECIKEVIFEEGVLSSIIAEVVRGTETQQIIETKQPTYQAPQVDHEARQRKLQEQRKRMLDAIGTESYNGVDVFAGTQPLNERRSSATSPHGSRPFDGIDPSDSGVNLGALGVNPDIWKRLAGK